MIENQTIEALLMVDGISYHLNRGAKINCKISDPEKDLLTIY